MLIFVQAPTAQAQEERLRGRGDPEEKVEARLAKAAEEIAVAAELGMTIVVNDDLERAVAEIQDLINDGRRARRSDEPGW